MKRIKAPMKDLLCGNDRPQRTNPRYLILVELKKRVWKKIGWDADGKGIDPWGGLPVQFEFSTGAEVIVPGFPASPEAKSANPGTADPNTEARWNKDWSLNETTGNEDLDNILSGDPMDMFQWDEWESLASEFFAN